MSQENVELVRGVLLPFERDDIKPVFEDESIWAAVVAAAADLFSDDFACALIRDDLGRAEYAGLDGLRAAWLDWLAPWATYQPRVEDVIDAGDGRVVVLTHDHARPRDAAAEISFSGAPIWVIREGKVARIDFYWDRADGLAAAGLEE